jgi:hypothetical protein
MKNLLRSHDYKTLRNTIGKPNYLFNIKKFEVHFSLICSLILTFITLLFAFSNVKNENYEYFIGVTQNIVLNTTFGLLGLLGFIISGLAIISGTIGHKVTSQIIQKKKFDSLLSILFSFFFIGRFIGVVIVLFISSYFLLGISLKFTLIGYGIMSFVLSYCLFFIIFFSVSLLGTCLNIFILNYVYSRVDTTDEEHVNELFNDFRIDALTAI